MKRFLKFRYGEKGFTLIELLIVVAILGILAAVIIPNAAGFMTAGTLNAANTEVANIKTAAVGYMAEHNGVWPVDTTVDDFDDYYEGTLKATYYFGNSTTEQNGSGTPPVNVSTIHAADATIANGWGTAIVWSFAKQQWIRTPSLN